MSTGGTPTTSRQEPQAALLLRIAQLEDQLREAEETLGAIRSGDVDAVVVDGPDGQQVYTLESADRPYRILIEQMQEGAVTLTAAGIVLYCNRCFAATVKEAMERVVGAPIQRFIADDQSAVLERLLSDARNGRARGEILLRAADGSAVHAQLSVVGLPSGSGETGRVLCAVVTDLSERRRLEEQLRQSQKMDTIGQLTGSLAHDFNNLLMAVISNLDLLRKRHSTDPRALRLVSGAMEGAKRGAALTQRLLAFARRQDLRTESVDIARLLHGVADLLNRSVGPLVEMRMVVKAGLPAARVDANQLELALLNLVLNAGDAMPDGGQLTISLDQAEITEPTWDSLSPGAYLRLAVTDTGIGMDDRTLAQAIEPFFSTKGSAKGTGLGLAMVHGLALQLGGALRLSSTVGQGTTAELWLPVSSTPARIAVEEPVTAQVTPPATILVVDDDALIAMSTADMLRDLGHTVLEAESGAGALKILKEGSAIDILVTDQAMPGMRGSELAVEARALRPNLRVLLATGYSDLRDGAADLPCIGKPYQQDELANAIARLMAPAICS